MGLACILRLSVCKVDLFLFFHREALLAVADNETAEKQRGDCQTCLYGSSHFMEEIIPCGNGQRSKRDQPKKSDKDVDVEQDTVRLLLLCVSL